MRYWRKPQTPVFILPYLKPLFKRMKNIDTIAEELRGEPFQMFGNNCLRKALKFRKECRKIGISARVIFAFVTTPCKRFPLPPWVVWFHAWAEVDGQRIELARPLDEKNAANTFDSNIRPVIAIRRGKSKR